MALHARIESQYADILSDLGAETAGGLGLALSGCFGDAWAMMLDHMGLGAEAQRLEAAVARVYRDGKPLTPDQGGAATTKEMAQAVLEAYRNA